MPQLTRKLPNGVIIISKDRYGSNDTVTWLKTSDRKLTCIKAGNRWRLNDVFEISVDDIIEELDTVIWFKIYYKKLL